MKPFTAWMPSGEPCGGWPSHAATCSNGSRRRTLPIAAPRTGVGDLLHTARTLAIGPLTAVATVAGLSMLRPAALGPAAAVLLLWFFSPLIIWWLTGRCSAGSRR
jgi:hypothetical protein